MNRENLTILADYLYSLPADPQRFDMGLFYGNLGEIGLPRTYVCGTIACAVGHGPAAGIAIPEGASTWNDYLEEVFGFTYFSAYGVWCFSGGWHSVDNTPRGAALRIRHMLEHGVPSNYHEQKCGEAPYLFAQEISA